MQGTYIPQYTPVPPTAVSIEVSLVLSCRKRVGEIHLSHIECGPRNPRIPYMCVIVLLWHLKLQAQDMKMCAFTWLCLGFPLHIK